MRLNKMANVYVILSVLFISGVFAQYPEQIHLSYGQDLSQMVVNWVTLLQSNDSYVEYGTDKNLGMWTNGTECVFVDGGTEHRKLYIHKVVLNNLLPNQHYWYHVGSPKFGWSPLFWFTTRKLGTNWPARFAVYGDLGAANAKSLARLQEETEKGHFDAILHVGDFAYNMDTNQAKVGDLFMKEIESIAAYLPYMTCVGNHEGAYNFSNYAKRFSMPGGDGQNMFYSFDVGKAHIIAFSTEFYYFPQYGLMQVINQYNWLKQDLEKANKNREKVPWIITMGHRPMYCSNNDHDDCTNNESMVRTGLPILEEYGLEDLFYKYGVDLEIWAHEHSYERLWPVYNRKVCNGSFEQPYTNPQAPVHVVTGSAGCGEVHDHFGPPREWTAVQWEDFGYSRLTVYNSTHLHFEQVSDDKGGKVIDSIDVIKQKHGAGLFSCH